uniref:Activating signal cointegrator 1 complex subunit 1 n=1 Tax=Anolis carolinensis TaxID=28377 RepID=A0A803T930_ANOCA|nr:PREDICTED: activating signal cointegrator 1 complex subunit 1 isoform X1 [Anolis carolinensis]XP_016847685.1 PREDICTED: activating signal cointegrator 1 complex subunit 1 isoform X1 [Anolis carolinensis]|eukprot:XP_016847684.1 PREDICTED: activating signal cointegrator 1 complex subunit 1 isoform X1 [Anolis carolinensis]
MEVLRPTLIRIGGRVYRKTNVREQAHQQEEEEDFYAAPGDAADEPCDAFMIEETERGYRCAMDIPSPLYKYIIGKKGETKKKLETETRTSINIPGPGVEGEIVITGQHRNGVVSARTRIDVLAESFRKKQPFTHFLSIALNQAAIQEKFLQFKEEVLEKCSNDCGISSTLFQNPAKLHLTIGTLVLLNEQEIQKAQELLKKCKEDFIDSITGGKPLTIEVTGIEYMNDDPAMIDVLYAKVHTKDGSKLQLIADRMMERFVTSGLMMKEWDRVKLHATVMNTLFRKDPSAEEQNNRTAGKASKERESFDGRKILKVSLKQQASLSYARRQFTVKLKINYKLDLHLYTEYGILIGNAIVHAKNKINSNWTTFIVSDECPSAPKINEYYCGPHNFLLLIQLLH